MENNIDEINSLPHDLTVAKFEADYLYKFGLNLLFDYLTSGKQRFKVILQLMN